MKNKKDENWLDENISRAVDIGEVKFNAQRWREKYILNESVSTKHSTIKPYKILWRFIMENKVTRYSAMAVIVLAMVLVLLSPFGTPGNGGVVLANVQKRVANIETTIIRGSKTFTHPGKPDEVFEFAGIKWDFDLVKYYSKQHGLVEEGYVGDELIYRITLNRPKQQVLVIMSPWKKYLLLNSTDKQVQIFLENLTPDGIVNLLLESTYMELGKDNIDGVEVEGFEFQNAEHFVRLFPKALFNLQNAKGKVWIGIEEQLPVQVEGDMTIGKSFMTMFNDLNLHEFNILGNYDVELDEEIFDTSPPEGYTELTLSDILSLIPLEAKAGIAGLGITPLGFIFWKKHRKKKTKYKLHQ